MSESVRVSMIVMLGAGGLFTGGLVWYAWERVWIWRRLDLHEYAVDFRRSVRKADPALRSSSSSAEWPPAASPSSPRELRERWHSPASVF
jgi:hypothetical protein